MGNLLLEKLIIFKDRAMIYDRILELISQGKSASLEFKEQQVRPESLAREMVAFANTIF